MPAPDAIPNLPPPSAPPPAIGAAIAAALREREAARPGAPHYLPRDLRREAADLASRGLLRAATADGFWRVTPAGLEALGLAG